MTTELLAPAGNLACLKSAVRNGANAVYLGMGDFNARNNIANFSKEDLLEGVKFAHLFGVKVYLTLNILIKDEEIENVIEFVRYAISCKVDAFIMQDIGLASLLKQKFDGIELHASTQMGICNLEGAKFLKEQGFSRIVLARETALAEIKRIKDNLDIELEYFIHGALCVGYSGNCYFSSLEEGASGNRGKCKQLCRLPFSMEYGKTKKDGYLLSTRDLCMVFYLKQLAQAGITSFKIEGRARRESYVAGAVKIYREVIDNNFDFSDEQVFALKKLFNRGDFSAGYLTEGKKIYTKINSHIGVEIGNVISFKKGNKFNEVYVSSRHNIVSGDVLQFMGEKISSISAIDVKDVGANTYRITTTSFVENGATVRLLVDKKYEDDLLHNERKLSVDASLIAYVGTKPTITLSCSGVTIIEHGEENCMSAKSKPLDQDEAKTQISKMGDDFKINNFAFKSDGVFMAKSQLNIIRRNALEKLKNEIIKSNETNYIKENNIKLIQNNKKISKNNKKILIFNNINNILNEKSDNYIIYNPKIYNKNEIIALANKTNKIIYLFTPVNAQKADIDFLKEIINSCDNIGVLANNYYALALTTPEKIIIGSELNAFNNFSINFYRKLGYKNIILSKEVDIQTNDKEGLFVNNLKENLIYFKHCPIKEHIGGNCGDCKFKEGITYSLGRKKYTLQRQKIVNCIFYLKSTFVYEKLITGFGQVIEDE